MSDGMLCEISMIRRIWFNREFMIARLFYYILLAIMGWIMVFHDPFTYRCNEPGMQCPFCGIKTGLYYLLHGNWQTALQANRFMPVILCAVLFVVVDLLVIIVKLIKKQLN